MLQRIGPHNIRVSEDFDSTRATLLLRLRDRTDSLSWQAFHQRYGELLLRYARSRGASAVDAEDIDLLTEEFHTALSAAAKA